ncbi:hypothetical protein EIN_186380 [Entamoeba invadens IP1]|uniref:hypothetical protein n=1 Tax=Entamoeba invadens IP1 TaxID=370355 RepID=UPI0002C3D19E|nr:hypothetical protein EIN_186380 [Entamoeba invadens IP1]ELP94211.1 hypothetical protein EIN_186380 [Entamoeba invadens IP1]|eukprot:XP_004260982.1 hypothetical protein EIN_186380 [Entamoeba invadens IP1]
MARELIIEEVNKAVHSKIGVQVSECVEISKKLFPHLTTNGCALLTTLYFSQKNKTGLVSFKKLIYVLQLLDYLNVLMKELSYKIIAVLIFLVLDKDFSGTLELKEITNMFCQKYHNSEILKKQTLKFFKECGKNADGFLTLEETIKETSRTKDSNMTLETCLKTIELHYGKEYDLLESDNKSPLKTTVAQSVLLIFPKESHNKLERLVNVIVEIAFESKRHTTKREYVMLRRMFDFLKVKNNNILDEKCLLVVLFRLLDKNSSGKVSLKEFRALSSTETPIQKSDYENVLKTLDKNDDGVLQLEEFMNLGMFTFFVLNTSTQKDVPSFLNNIQKIEKHYAPVFTKGVVMHNYDGKFLSKLNQKPKEGYVDWIYVKHQLDDQYEKGNMMKFLFDVADDKNLNIITWKQSKIIEDYIKKFDGNEDDKEILSICFDLVEHNGVINTEEIEGIFRHTCLREFDKQSDNLLVYDLNRNGLFNKSVYLKFMEENYLSPKEDKKSKFLNESISTFRKLDVNNNKMLTEVVVLNLFGRFENANEWFCCYIAAVKRNIWKRLLHINEEQFVKLMVMLNEKIEAMKADNEDLFSVELRVYVNNNVFCFGNEVVEELGTVDTFNLKRANDVNFEGVYTQNDFDAFSKYVETLC